MMEKFFIFISIFSVHILFPGELKNEISIWWKKEEKLSLSHFQMENDKLILALLYLFAPARAFFAEQK
jgi:hypothetical protein